MVKNLPANTEKDELKSLFEKHGALARFLLPKHGITALVDFIEPFEAKKAFTKLAYSQYKAAPLYLEWAPENVFVKSNEQPEQENKSETKDTKKKETKGKYSNSKQNEAESSSNQNTDNPEETMEDKSIEESDEKQEPENNTTLFVKNLNFLTTEVTLKNVS